MRKALALSVGFALVACGGKSDGAPDAGAATVLPSAKGKVLEAAENETTKDAGSTAKAAADPTVPIPAGKLVAGSTPGDRGRDPLVEPALWEVELGAYDIDRAPYPNEPGKPPLTGVTREKAGELCKARGRRLCTELEWEHACKGPGDDPFAGRAAWDPACAKTPDSCASGFGVLAMGSALREWTSSEVAEVKELAPGGAAVRGASASAAEVDHRCAHRSRADATASSDDLGFRCCGGAPNAASVPAPAADPTFTKVDFGPEKVAELFSTVPQLRKLGGDLKYFDEAAAKEVVARSDAGDPPKGVTLTTSPLVWSPIPGERILVLTGLAGDDSFIVAFYKLPDDRYRLASTMVLHKDKGPVVIGYSGYDGRRTKERSIGSLDWATCWKCPGESGAITYREDNRVVVTQE
jgi:hypothetical protein